MPDRDTPFDTALDASRRAGFGVLDVVRRMQGDLLGTLGLNADEAAYRVTDTGAFWRLRDYGGAAGSPSLLIVAAPIKRPYIWDLTPSVSAIRFCLHAGLHVHLLEWLPATHASASNGLAEYAEAISRCAAGVAEHDGSERPFLAGHSLGGTLAAIAAAWRPSSLRALVLLGAPLCFASATSRFRDALVSLVPSTLSAAEPFPGSLLSQASAMASPQAFVWARLTDAIGSLTDQQALDIHARVERWALDEAPLPGKLVHEIVEWLYRDNRFCRGQLMLAQTRIGPDTITAPVLAVVNTGDDVAPPSAIAPCAQAMQLGQLQIIEHPGEIGVCLQHLGILVGREARARVWPRIIDWLAGQRSGAAP